MPVRCGNNGAHAPTTSRCRPRRPGSRRSAASRVPPSAAPPTGRASRTACSRATSRPIPASCGRAPTGPPACWSRRRPPTASATSSPAPMSTRCRKAISPPRCCSRTCRPEPDIFYRVQFQDLASPTILGEPMVGHFRTAPAERRSVSFVWSGDTAGQGWGIDEARGGMRTYATMLANRPDFFIHSGDTIYADCTIPREQRMPNGETWRNLVTEEKSRVAETLADYRGNYKYNLLDAQPARLQRRRSRCSPSGTTTRCATTGARASSRTKACGATSLLLAARGCRAFHEYMPMRETMAEPGRVYRKIAYGPLLDVFMLDMRSYRGPNGAVAPGNCGPAARLLGPKQIAWLKRELAASRATWKVIAADLPLGLASGDAVGFGDGPPLRARARDRRPARLHQARRRAQHGVDHRRRALHGGASLRSQPRPVPGFRAVLGIRLRADPCRHVVAERPRQHVRSASHVPEGLEPRAGRTCRRASACSSSATWRSTARAK